MIVLTNGRAYALAVDATLFLPTGRGVPLADAGSWTETDEDPEVATAACLAAARAEEAARAQLDAPRFVLPKLPQSDAPRPLRIDPATEEFVARCTALLQVIDRHDSKWARDAASFLRSYVATAQRGVLTDPMWFTLTRVEKAWDPEYIRAFIEKLRALIVDLEETPGNTPQGIAQTYAGQCRALINYAEGIHYVSNRSERALANIIAVRAGYDKNAQRKAARVSGVVDSSDANPGTSRPPPFPRPS